MAGCAGAVACGEEALYGGHVVVHTDGFPLLLVFGGHYVFGTAYPCAGSAGVRTDEVRFGCGDFRGLLFGLDVHAGPEQRLADRHVEEVFPGFAFEFFHLPLESLGIVFVLGGDVGDGLFRSHVDRAFAREHVFHAQPVAQVGRDGFGQTVRRPLGQLIGAGYHVFLAKRVGRAGLEQEEPCADRAVAVFEPYRNEAYFLAGHLSAGLDGEICGRTGIPRGIPGASETLTNRTGTENVNGAAHGCDRRFGLEYVELILANAETNGAGARGRRPSEARR